MQIDEAYADSLAPNAGAIKNARGVVIKRKLAGRPKGHPVKVRIAGHLRRETTMTLAWIAQRLHLGSAGHLSCLLYRKTGNGAQTENHNESESENKKLF